MNFFSPVCSLHYRSIGNIANCYWWQLGCWRAMTNSTDVLRCLVGEKYINYICQNLPCRLVGFLGSGTWWGERARLWGGRRAGLNLGTHDGGLVKYTVDEALDAAHPEVTTVEWVKRSQSRNCSLNMCHTLKCRGKHPYTHQYDEQKSPKPKLWSLYFCYRERKKIYILENKNKSQNRRGRKKRLQILRWMQRKMNCTSWVRHSGTRGYFLELDF